MIQNEKARSVLTVVTATLLWSFGAPIAKFVESPALTLIFFRSLSGLAFLILIIKLKHGGKVFKVNPLYIIGGILYAFTTISFYTALKFTTAANVTILANTSPIFLSLLGFIFLHETPAMRDWLVLIIIMAGILLCFYGGISLNGSTGDLLALGAAAAFSLLAVIIKKIDSKNLLQPLIWGNLIAVLLATPGVSSSGSVIIEDIPLFFIMGIFSMALPFFLYSKGQQRLGAMEASLYKLIEPVVAPVWVGLITGEIPAVYSVLGGVLVITALFFNTCIQYRKKH